MATFALIEQDLTHSVIGAFFEVYNTLGYGFLEQVYAVALERELTALGHTVIREVMIRVRYKGQDVSLHRLDMVVDGKLIVEVKATEKLHPWSARQIQNYLRATDLRVGLLLHFGPSPAFFRLISTNK